MQIPRRPDTQGLGMTDGGPGVGIQGGCQNGRVNVDPAPSSHDRSQAEAENRPQVYGLGGGPT